MRVGIPRKSQKYLPEWKRKEHPRGKGTRAFTTVTNGGAMDEEEDEIAMLARRRATIRNTGKGLQELLSDVKTDAGLQMERLEDEEKLTDIIHTHRVRGTRSIEIARAIIRFVKEG
jgi:hypothetical protein